MKLSLLINPFNKLTDNKLIASAVMITIFGILMAYSFNTRFDGVLDVHFAKDVDILQVLTDLAVNSTVLWTMLYIAAIFLNRRTRAVDILHVALIARLPYYILPVFNAGSGMYLAAQKMLTAVQEGTLPVDAGDMTLITVFAISSIAMMIWYAILLYNGFRIATNGKGPKTIGLTIIAILTAEVVSKLIFYYTATKL